MPDHPGQGLQSPGGPVALPAPLGPRGAAGLLREGAETVSRASGS